MSDDKLVNDALAKLSELEARFQPDPLKRHRVAGRVMAEQEANAADRVVDINRATARVVEARNGVYASYPDACKALHRLRIAVRDASDALAVWELALSDLVGEFEDDDQ